MERSAEPARTGAASGVGLNPGAELIRCVGAVVHDAVGKLLLIQRGHEPALGQWSLPGGKVRPAESDADAVAREVWEETGLVVLRGRLLGSVRRERYAIFDYACAPRGGRLRAGDDAADARWVTAAEFGQLALTEGLTTSLREWGALPVG